MTTVLEGLDFQKKPDEEKVHYLPCKVHYNGKSNISKYFKSEVSTKDTEEDHQVSFRGYPLDGKTISIPESFHGFLLNSTTSGNVAVEKSFRSMTYWDWDKLPSKNDSFISALDWLHMSKEIHDPIEDEN